MSPSPRLALALSVLLAPLAAGQDEVDLFFVPEGCVDTGDVVRVDLFAASSTANTTAIAALDVLLAWDPAELELVDVDNTFADHAWLLTGFLPDPDGVNTSTTDGEALFTALTSPGLPAAVPPTPLRVTTFLFRPIVALPTGSGVSLAASAGTFARTAVYSYVTPGLAVTGDISDVATLFTCPFGGRYCTGAIPNSTGQSGRIEANGSPVVAQNDLQLSVSRLPLNSFGFVLASELQDFRPFPGGSQGILCLGDPIGRGVGDVIFSTGATGTATVPADLTAMPQPTGSVAVAPGDTWRFQCWHRDVNPVQTSNFTDAISIEFQ